MITCMQPNQIKLNNTYKSELKNKENIRIMKKQRENVSYKKQRENASYENAAIKCEL